MLDGNTTNNPNNIHVIYQDDHIVAIDKPCGLLVHRSDIDKHETRFALQETRNLIGKHLYPVHRLDKPTSGVLLFALSSDVAKHIQQQFESCEIEKEYLLVTRGFTPEHAEINHALVPKNDFKKKRQKSTDSVVASVVKPAQDAVTHYQRLATLELEAEIDRYPISRFSLVKAFPKTGRKHQIRRHFKHLSHPIIGCPKYGKSRYNHYFANRLHCPRLLLHCYAMTFIHPISQQPIRIESKLSGVFASLVTDHAWKSDEPLIDLIESLDGSVHAS